jgi:hypothetical protein
MRNKLAVTTAVIAAAIAVASCEKTPSEEPAATQKAPEPSQTPTENPTASQKAPEASRTPSENPTVSQKAPASEDQQDTAQAVQSKAQEQQQELADQKQRNIGSVSLTPEQRIRQAQIHLKEKGFEVGEVAGILGPRTRNALIAFQRQQGFNPTGQIDERTAAALGI